MAGGGRGVCRTRAQADGCPSLAARLPEQVDDRQQPIEVALLAGLRAGWLVGPKAVIKHAESLAMCMLFGLPGFIQEAAITALRWPSRRSPRIRDLCTVRRDMLLDGTSGLRGVSCCVPDAGMFTLMDVRGTGLSGYDFMCALYKTERLSVIDGGAFGAGTRGFVRLCFAADEGPLVEALVRIRRFVGTLVR